MSQKRPVNCFEWVEELFPFKEDFIKNYDENSNKRYFLEVDVEHSKNLHNLHNDLLLLPKRKKIKKCKKLVCDFCDKKNYVVHVNTLKQALNQGLILKKGQKVIQSNQKALTYIDMNTELRKKQKKILKRISLR